MSTNGSWTGPTGRGCSSTCATCRGPLRLRDLPGFVRSLGYFPDLVWSQTLLATPMRHGGEHVGNFFLAGKDGGGEFADKDEGVLVLFASQAAIANAHAPSAGRP